MAPEIIPEDVVIDEEKYPAYDPKYFYHPNPGDVLKGRYLLNAKIGWGTCSTVWLAQDLGWKNKLSKTTEYVAIKINESNYASKKDARHELMISNRIIKTKSDVRGRKLLRTALRSFELTSPSGLHVCLVFEPMRETISIWRHHFGAGKVLRPYLKLFKCFIRLLVESLGWLHSECKIVHTDLKLDNILVTFENQDVIEKFFRAQADNPMPRKYVGDRAVYLCHNDFGDFGLAKEALRCMLPKITDFGSAQLADQPGTMLHPIQPNHLRAPEVLLGTGWSTSADIWNLGVMVYDLLAGTELFRGCYGPQPYSAGDHLAQMIALLGPPPKALLEREKQARRTEWSPKILDDNETLCRNACEFYGGPFFSNDGELINKELIPLERNLADEIPHCIPDEEKDAFLKFMRRMLCWLPDERATGRDLMNDPWLTS